MAWVATAVIGAGVLGAGASIYGSSLQAGAANNATNAQMSMFDRTQANLAPYMQAGASALPTLQGLITPGPNQTSTLNNIPGFTFAQDWGQKAVQNLGTMRGIGGNVLKAGADYATGAAQQGWGSIVNALQGLVNTGGNAAAGASNAALTTGGQIGSNIIGGANAQAAGAVGAANQIGGGITTSALLQALTKSGGMYGNADKGTGTSMFGSGGYNFLDAAAG